jgi:hypothetical protein
MKNGQDQDAGIKEALRMKQRWLGMTTALGAGAVALALTALWKARSGSGRSAAAGALSGDADSADRTGAERVTADQGAPAFATGRDVDHDPLEPTHTLPPPEAERARARERLVGGKAASEERGQMYDNSRDDVHTSGSQGETPSQSDRNPIGRQAM